MSRALTGSLRRRDGRWCASLPVAKGTTCRREERFDSEAEARAWLSVATAALASDRPLPAPARRAPAPSPRRSGGSDASKVSPDIASVANAWMSAAYEDLRRGGPERAEGVRRIVEAYLVPWFAPRTETVADISYFMAHEWLLQLVGRGDPRAIPSAARGSRGLPADPGSGTTEVGLREAARLSDVSLPTVRRRWREGRLSGAYRDEKGRVRVPTRALRQVHARNGQPPNGLSKRYVSEALWILRRVLSFARANGLFPAGFDPTEGLDAPLPDQAASRSRPGEGKSRPLTLPECARIASHLHVVHQTVFWLQRIMGLRISEAFGLLVGDVVDLGETGLLAVQGQGGKTFFVRDGDGAVVAVPHKETAKTAAGSRVLVVPATMMELLRVAIEAFHTDPDTGAVDPAARLVPGIHNHNSGGQVGYHTALADAAAEEQLGTEDLGFRVSSHLLRKSCATDIAWAEGIEETVRRRFMGHRAGEDVFGRIYTLDHPDVAPLAKVAALLDENITNAVGNLLTPTSRTVHWRNDNPLFARADHVAATLAAAGWQIEPGDPDDPLCDARRVAAELGIVATTARRRMTDGTLRSVVVSDENGVPRRFSRLSDVWVHRDQLAGVIRLPDLAERLGVRYDEAYRSMRQLGLRPRQHPTSKELILSDEEAAVLRAEHERIRALHGRSMKLAAAARMLGLAFTTVRLFALNGALEFDAETDTSGARFVTRQSVERCWIERSKAERRKASEVPTVPLAEVVRFTGLGRRAVIDLIRAGLLEELPGRRTCDITTASLQAWLEDHDQDYRLEGPDKPGVGESPRGTGVTCRARESTGAAGRRRLWDHLGVTIRNATDADLEACQAIVRGLPDYFTDDVPEKIARDLGVHLGWVVTDDADVVVAFAIVARRLSRAAEILWMAVRTDRRHSGLGTSLLEHVLAALGAEGVTLVEAKTLDASAAYEPYLATRAFWERHGFVQVDTIDPLPGWQPGNPAAIYVCALEATH